MAIHFGAGALGRGLVVPKLVAAGWRVIVVDADKTLVDSLAAQGGYPLVVVDGDAEHTQRISIHGAMHPQDPALVSLLASVSLVTTAVRRENLGRVASALVSAWSAHGMAAPVSVVGCENVEQVDSVLAEAFTAVGISDAQRAGLHLPRTVVDRICASAWPQSLAVTTEPFTELAIGSAVSIPGFEQVENIDALFARKRYLVNAFADASAILGVPRGLKSLSEAVRDVEIQRTIAPLLDALIRYLVADYGFSARDLAAYLETSRARLANTAIPRSLETVARDVWRKLGPTERFAEPLIALQAQAALSDEAVRVVAALVRAAIAADPAIGPFPRWPDLPPAASAFYARVDAAAGAR